ncbi:MAG: hypothetical protein ABIF11_06720 [Nitrospirota bacterium]
MKRLLTLITAMSVIGFAGVSSADTTANIAITVQIQSLGVSVSPGLWTIGAVGAGSTQDSGAFSVTNTGNITEKFALNTANSANWTNNAGGSAGVNQFVLKGLFDTAGAHTFATDDDITNSSVTASTTIFSDGDANGTNVSVAASRDLFLRLNLPTAGSNTNSQTINVTVTAQAQ